MYDHTFYKQVQINRSDIRPHIKWAVSLVILHMVTSIFLQGLCGYIWVNILTLSPRRGGYILIGCKDKNSTTFACGPVSPDHVVARWTNLCICYCII